VKGQAVDRAIAIAYKDPENRNSICGRFRVNWTARCVVNIMRFPAGERWCSGSL
jgi:hypothetical protein